MNLACPRLERSNFLRVVVESSSHRRRLAEHCTLVANRLGLDGSQLGLAAWLHDVGMTPMSFVDRPGGLSASERERVRTHPELGRELLIGSGSPLYQAAAEIAWTHHERFDGGGYPRGLAGDEIPLPGRIVAVADAFDALTTDRPHRRAQPLAVALDVMRRERGRQFDPDVLDAFLGDMEAIEATLRRFPGEPVGSDTGEYLTLQVAAAALGASRSQLRRWADEGRIAAIRTAGGHRRFRRDDVRRLADEMGALPRLRPVAPPDRPLPGTAETLRVFGDQITGGAALSIYQDAPVGWLAGETAGPERREWAEAIQAACETGMYALALDATELLFRLARTHGTTLLERHAFLERFGQILVRALGRQSSGKDEIPAIRRLVVALQQAALQSYE